MSKKQSSDEHVPLTPAVFHILLALSAGELHGYAIMQEIDWITAGSLKVGPGTLYRSLKQMVADGLILESEERPEADLDDQRRRYYRLTEHGRKVAETEARRLERVVRAAQSRRLIGESPSVQGA